MEELITLNQLKAYDAEKTNKLNNQFNNIDNGFNNVNNQFNNIDNGFNNVNNQFNNIDSNILNLSNYVNNIHDELNETYNNFNVSNLVATNATITDLNVANVVAGSLDVNTVLVNGNVGNNGQVLGVVNGKSEWMDIPGSIDTDNFSVNNLYVNNIATVTDLNVVNTLYINGNVGNNGQVLGVVNGKSEWMNVSGSIDTDNFYVNNIYVNNIAKVNGFDVTSYVMMDESEYNSLPNSEKEKPIFYLTKPYGNLYLQGYGYSPSMLPPAIHSVWVNLFNTRTNVVTHSLDLGNTDVTNAGNFSVYGVQRDNVWANALSVNVNASGNTLSTTANELYIYNASRMYNNCRNLIDTFICNPALITNAPEGYDPLRYCVNMDSTFSHCYNFNQPITIPNSVTNMSDTFAFCRNFNQPITIPDNVTDMSGTFAACWNFNQPVTIPNSVTNMVGTFDNCLNFNQPITIPDNVTDMPGTFAFCRNFNQPITIPDNVIEMFGTFENCLNFNKPITIGNNVTGMSRTFAFCEVFNQPVTIPNSVTYMSGTFENCRRFNQPVTIPDNVIDMTSTFVSCLTLADSTVPIHISSSIALGNRSNYIYNMLVNGDCGISFDPSRILNDA